MSYTCYAAVLIYNNQKFNNIRTNKIHDQELRQGLSFKAKDRTKDWRLKAKDRTKDCQIVLKDNQGPRPRTTSLRFSKLLGCSVQPLGLWGVVDPKTWLFPRWIPF